MSDDRDPSEVINRSGGIDVGGDANIDGDVVGRDNIRAATYIKNATIIQSTAAIQKDRAKARPERTRQIWGGLEFVCVPAGQFFMGSAASG